MNDTGAIPASPRTTRPKPRRGLVENELYTQAAHLFAERGFAGTSLQDIAEALGVTRPALYHYVKSKDELLAKLVTEVTEGAAGKALRVSRRTDLPPAERLRMLAHQMVVDRATEPARFRLLDRSEADLPADLAAVHGKAKRTLLAEVAKVIDDGILAGHFRPIDARVAALGVIGMCNWVAWWFRPGADHPVEPVAEQLSRMAVASVAKDGDALSGGPAAAFTRLRQDLDYLERIFEG